MSDTSAAGLLVTSGASMKASLFHSRSCSLSIPPTVPRFYTWRLRWRYRPCTGEGSGTAKDEVVTWAITNASSRPITVRLVNFLRRRHPTDPHGQDPAATHFVWLGRNHLTLEDRETDSWRCVEDRAASRAKDGRQHLLHNRGAKQWTALRSRLTTTRR